MRRVLIFGSRGMLAHDLKAAFLKRRWFVVGADIDRCDITDAQAVRALVKRIRPSLVVNTAVRQDLDACERDPGATMQVNALGARAIAVVAAELAIPVVQMSTMYVFSGEKVSAYAENDAPAPVNVYGVSKLAGELLVCAANPRHFVIRTNFLFGRHYNAAKGGNGNFVQRILSIAREKGEVRVVTDQVASITYTKDLAEAIVRLVGTDIYGTYHITNSGSVSLYDEAHEILRIAGLADSVRLVPARLADFPVLGRRPPITRVRSTRLLRAGIRPLRHWKRALAAYLEEIGIAKLR